MDKGKKPVNGEEIGNPLPMGSSSHPTNTDLNLFLSDNNMFSNGSESSDSSSKRGFPIQDEPEEDEVDSYPIGESSKTKADVESMVDLAADVVEDTSVVGQITGRVQPVIPLRRTMTPDVLATLSIQDPKKAKRIIANRKSAMRAKEKKKLYTYMLEHQVHTLKSHAASHNANLALIEAENLNLTSENAMLKDKTNFVLHQIHIQDSVNDEIRNEIRELRTLTETSGNTSSISPAAGNQRYQNNRAPSFPFRLEQMNDGQQFQPLQVQSANVTPQIGDLNLELPAEDPNSNEFNPFFRWNREDHQRN